jgi:hypothetical protein
MDEPHAWWIRSNDNFSVNRRIGSAIGGRGGESVGSRAETLARIRPTFYHPLVANE